MHLLFIIFIPFFLYSIYAFGLHKYNIFNYDEKLFTVSTGFSTSIFYIFHCRNSSYYGISVVFATLHCHILIFTQYAVNVYTLFVCIYINM